MDPYLLFHKFIIKKAMVEEQCIRSLLAMVAIEVPEHSGPQETLKARLLLSRGGYELIEVLLADPRPTHTLERKEIRLMRGEDQIGAYLIEITIDGSEIKVTATEQGGTTNAF